MLRDGFYSASCEKLIIFNGHTLRSAALSMQNSGYLMHFGRKRGREGERETESEGGGGERGRGELRLHASDYKP